LGAQLNSIRTRRGLTGVLALLVLGASPLALAQQQGAPGANTPAARPAAGKPPAPKAKPKPQTEDQDEGTTVSELVISGKPPPGSVVGDIKPDLVLTPQEVQSYGVDTVDDLLNELEPQTSTGPGSPAPVVLLNGRRISGYNEVRDIPTEAILRVEILPQEVALKYGYSADQRVVNIVLRPFFRAKTVEATGGAPTAGGQIQAQGQLDDMRIRRDERLNLALKVQDSTDITDQARGVDPTVGSLPFDPLGNIVSPTPGAQIDPALSALAGRPVLVAGVPQGLTGAPNLADFVPTAGIPNASDLGADRTLAGSSSSASANLVYTRPTVANVQATVNATFGATRTESLQGLPSVALIVPAGSPFSPFSTPVTVAWDVSRFGPMRQVTDGWTAHLGTSLNRDTATWRFTLTGAYDHAGSSTHTDTGIDGEGLQQRVDAFDPGFNPFLPIGQALSGMLPQNLASSSTDTANVHILASGPILSLPAGKLNASIHAGDVQSWFSSNSTIAGQHLAASYWRNALNGRVNLDAPVARRGRALGFLGDVTVNGNAAVDRLSDFGLLTAYGYGVNWSPFTPITLLVSRTHDSTAPTFAQRDGPVVITPDARVLDFATGETVDVNMVSGGNPDLDAYSRDITRIGLTLHPFAKRELVITANYSRTFTHNPIETFPSATSQIQALFPDRFIRDADGDLDEVDYRPVNFASEDRSQLRWGVNYTFTFGKPPPPPTAEERAEMRKLFGDRAREFAQRRARQGQGQGGGFGPGGPGGGPPGGSDDGGPTPGGPGPDGQPPAGGPGPDGGGPGFGGPCGGGPGGGFGGGFGAGGGGRGGGFGGGRGGRGGGGGANQAPGRVQLALYHTITFEDRLTVRPGGPVFDALNGYPGGSGGGGLARHLIEAQAGVTWNGLGARASANWQSGTFLSGDGSPTGPLTFSPIGTVNLRLFADFAQMRRLTLHHPWLNGTRVTLAVLNLTDAHEQVRDSSGNTPPTYLPAYLDPVGRVVKLSVRKLFR